MSNPPFVDVQELERLRKIAQDFSAEHQARIKAERERDRALRRVKQLEAQLSESP
jgi:hypothetical protein